MSAATRSDFFMSLRYKLSVESRRVVGTVILQLAPAIPVELPRPAR